MSSYPTQSPPSYGTSGQTKQQRNEDRDPLLGTSSAFYDQPDAGETPDDFKYGVTVADSSPEIRNQFVRKVYTILFCQILATCLVAGGIRGSTVAISWVLQNVWAFYVPLFGTLINLGLLYWKRHSHPLNFFLLSTFTVMEAFTIGVLTAFYNTNLVLQALLITLGVFLGLTLFTLQSKYDFEGLGPFLFGGLMALVFTSFIGVFLPFSRTMDLIYAIGGCLIFSGYVVYDTYIINAKLSPDEYIVGAISLYLDFINLFLNILRLLNNLQER